MKVGFHNYLNSKLRMCGVIPIFLTFIDSMTLNEAVGKL